MVEYMYNLYQLLSERKNENTGKKAPTFYLEPVPSSNSRPHLGHSRYRFTGTFCLQKSHKYSFLQDMHLVAVRGIGSRHFSHLNILPQDRQLME